MRDEKVYAVVARSTFVSEKAKNTLPAEHFWKLRCRKNGRRCDAKHISKSKCTKHRSFGPLLEIAISKKCTPLWREARFEIKMYEIPHGALLELAMYISKLKCAKYRMKHFWKLRCQKSARRCGAKQISILRYIKHRSFGPLLDAEMPFRVAGTRVMQQEGRWIGGKILVTPIWEKD